MSDFAILVSLFRNFLKGFLDKCWRMLNIDFREISLISFWEFQNCSKKHIIQHINQDKIYILSQNFKICYLYEYHTIYNNQFIYFYKTLIRKNTILTHLSHNRFFSEYYR